MHCRKVSVIAIVFLCLCSFSTAGKSKPIYHEIAYPAGSGPFPAVIALHTAGGLRHMGPLIQQFVDSGFAVYAPDMFARHHITVSTRGDAFGIDSEAIGNELLEIINLMKSDPKVDKNNIFSAGYSAGGFFVCFLAGKAVVNAGVSQYGVWGGRKSWDMGDKPAGYLSKSSTPVLALHGKNDGTQKLYKVEWAWQSVKALGAPLEIYVYPEAGHAWDREGNYKYEYNEEVTKDSHNRTIEFFKKHMK